MFTKTRINVMNNYTKNNTACLGGLFELIQYNYKSESDAQSVLTALLYCHFMADMNTPGLFLCVLPGMEEGRRIW